MESRGGGSPQIALYSVDLGRRYQSQFPTCPFQHRKTERSRPRLQTAGLCSFLLRDVRLIADVALRQVDQIVCESSCAQTKARESSPPPSGRASTTSATCASTCCRASGDGGRRT